MLNSQSREALRLDQLPAELVHIIGKYDLDFVVRINERIIAQNKKPKSQKLNQPILSTMADLRFQDPYFIQEVLQSYFPYLNSGLNPISLLIREYNRRHNSELKNYNLTHEEWIRIIRGDLDLIKTKDNAQSCYVLAFASGNLTALEFINKEYITEALHLAAGFGFLGGVESLLKQYKTTLPISNEDLNEALIKAAVCGQTHIIDSLLVNHAQNISTKAASTALYKAAESGHTDTIACLIRHRGKNNFLTSFVGSALCLSANNNHLRTTKLLLDQFGRIITEKYKAFSLKVAAINDKLPILKCLLAKRCNPITTKSKSIALKEAIEHGHQKIANHLLSQYGKKMTGKQLGESMFAAAYSGRVSFVKRILANCDKKISNELTEIALETAAEKGHLAIVRNLLSTNKKRISSESKGRALINAADQGHLEVVQCLLKEGVGSGENDILIEDVADALINAAHYGHKSVLQHILARYHHILINEDKEDALILAADNEQEEAVNCLLTTCGKEISAEAKQQALDRANIRENNKIASLILVYCGKPALTESTKTLLFQFSSARSLSRYSLGELPPLFPVLYSRNVI